MVRSYGIKATVIFILATSISSHAQELSFKEFVQKTLSYQNNARVDEILPKIKQFKRLGNKALINKPTDLSFANYLKQSVTKDDLDALFSKYEMYYSQLNKIAKAYGVQPRFIISLWGIASNYGKSKANYSALSVYASKAYQKTSEENKSEFISAVKSISAGFISEEELTSDYNGGLGQLSVTPSFYNKYSVDWDKDGKKDIWHNHLDSFATIANFLNKHGWDDSSTWGRQVRLTKAIGSEIDLSNAYDLPFWSAQGLTKYNGSSLSARADIQSRLLKVPNSKGRVYLTYENFDVMKRWPNMDDYRLLSIMYLSERMNKKIKSM